MDVLIAAEDHGEFVGMVQDPFNQLRRAKLVVLDDINPDDAGPDVPLDKKPLVSGKSPRTPGYCLFAHSVAQCDGVHQHHHGLARGSDNNVVNTDNPDNPEFRTAKLERVRAA